MLKNSISHLLSIVKYASSIVGIRVFHLASNFIAMICISQLGQEQAAAGALITVFSNTVTLIFLSPILAVSIILSRYYGANQFRNAGNFFKSTIIISAILGLIVSLLLLGLPKILKLLDQPASVIPYTQKYFTQLSIGMVAFFVMACIHQFLFAIDKGFIPFIWSIITFLLVVSLGYCFTYGLFGFYKLGVAGFGAAISASNWFILLVGIVYLYFKKDLKKFRIFNFDRNVSLNHIKDMFNLGFPITMQFSGELVAFALLNIMVGWLGAENLNLQQIVIQTSTLALMIPMGSSQTCAILVGRSIGAKKSHNIKPIFFMGLMIVLICMIVIALFYIFKPTMIIQLFLNVKNTSNFNISSTARLLLIIAAFSQMFDAIRNLVIGTLRGMNDVWNPMLINVGLLFVFGLPIIAYYFGIYQEHGVVGINFAFLVTFIFGAIFMLKRFYCKTNEIAKYS